MAGEQTVVPGHVGYAPDYKSEKPVDKTSHFVVLPGDAVNSDEEKKIREVLGAKSCDTTLYAAVTLRNHIVELDKHARDLQTEIARKDRVVELARSVLQWDRDKAEAWLPGLYDALKALDE